MQVVFLGGASGIGASCIAIQTGGRWLLVDAGVRMDPRQDRLPDLAFLQDKTLAAIFVTHSHADHIGALPLVQQAFPAVPIYTSRATMLLMEVMLADALQVMARRATDAQEVPLYSEDEVNATLHMLRPLPLTGSVSVPEMPDVTVHTARSGHVAGAISVGFEAPDGRVIISGDVSVTPQRTVPGAALIDLKHPDLLVLESTYGARLHPNRQHEEQRLAQAVAEAIERGGHVLVPAFALGRAQEVLRILHDAQRRGHIPEFPIWVDGLVRTVCDTYTAMPEALTPALERQIRKGYAPFFTGMVRAVTEPRKREQIIQGPPACIVTSSGMLTGGPSVFYAGLLAEKAENAIFITGYQDEEAPGRRLLELADKGTGKLDLGEKSVTVRCHFARYSLSAHADGGELAGMVSALKPRMVALVHGDGDARGELAQRLQRICEVKLPADGMPIDIAASIEQAAKRRQRPRRKHVQAQTIALGGAGIGEGEPLESAGLPRLWQAVSDNSGEQVVSLHELVLAWYGTAAPPDAEATIRHLLAQDQRYFVPHPDVANMVKVLPPSAVDPESLPADQASDQAAQSLRPGALLLLSLYGEKLQPALCLDVHAETVRAYIPDGQRTRFPRLSVLEVLGTWSEQLTAEASKTRSALAELARAAQQWQRLNPLRALVEALEPEQEYTLEEVWHLLGIAADNLPGRLGAALLLNAHSDVLQRDGGSAMQQATYRLLSGEAVEQALAASDPRPDQTAILAVIERHLSNPPDLYKRSVNPDTGAVTLQFHFPDKARQQHQAAIEAAAAEARVAISIAPHPHQGALTDAAHAALPAGLGVSKTSVHLPRQAITLRCQGQADAAALQAAQEAFHERTAWTLEIEFTDGQRQPAAASTAAPAAPGQQPVLDMHHATSLVKATLGAESGCYKVSANQASHVLMVRFHFPDAAREKYAEQLAALAEQTGWQITIYPEPHQGELEALARRVLPPDLEIVGVPSLYRVNQQVVVRYRGVGDAQAFHEAEQTFARESGWQLVVRGE